MKKAFLIIFVVVSCARADPFRNLGFEEADVSNVQVGGGASSAQLIPGWHLFSEDYGEVTALTYDHKLTEPGDFTLFDSPPQGGASVEGRFYLAWIDADSTKPPYKIETTSLIQRGDIPSDAKALYFHRIYGLFDVQINGKSIPTFDYSPTEIRADVSAYAGQNVELSFNSVQYQVSGGLPFWGLDNVGFSPTLVPEPSTWYILVCGALLLIPKRFLRSRFNSRN